MEKTVKGVQVFRYVAIRIDGGRRSVGTLVTLGGRRVLFTERLTRDQVQERAQKMLSKKKTEPAARAFREWYGMKKPRIYTRSIPAGPFVFLGTVPAITYGRKRRGKYVKYYHEPKRRPRLYYDARTGALVMLGGSTRVRQGWLRG